MHVPVPQNLEKTEEGLQTTRARTSSNTGATCRCSHAAGRRRNFGMSDSDSSADEANDTNDAHNSGDETLPQGGH